MLRLGALGILGLLVLRATDLTVRRHQELYQQAERRRRRVEVLPARRGEILARDGRPLALDHEVEDVVVDLPQLDPALDLVTPLARALELPRPAALERLRAARLAVSLDPAVGEVTLGACALDEAPRVRRALRRTRGIRLTARPSGLEVVADAELIRRRDAVLQRLAPVLGRGVAELTSEVEAAVDRIHAEPDRYERIALWRQPLAVLPEADFDAVARVAELGFELAGVSRRKRYRRIYPQGPIAAHVVGKTGAPTRRELIENRERILDGDPDALGFRLGERHEVPQRARLRDQPSGRTGVERSLEPILSGTPGVRVTVKDARNRLQEVLLQAAPQDGVTIRLTLDVDIQRAVEQALDEGLALAEPSSGAAGVVLDLEHGDLLALASAPRFDPNSKGRDFPQLLEDPRKPLLHRAVLAFPPGSTWKVLSALAAMEPGHALSLPLSWTTDCRGYLFRESRAFSCDHHHGRTGLRRSLSESCNVFYFRVADALGRGHLGPAGTERKLAPGQALDRVRAWAERLGMTGALIPDLGGEERGLVPRADYKQRRLKQAVASLQAHRRRVARLQADPTASPAALERAQARLARAEWWAGACQNDVTLRPGDARNALIGQGDVLATPVQVAWLAAVIAGGGKAALPRIHYETPVRHLDAQLDPGLIGPIRQGLRDCVRTRQGTANGVLGDLDMAGKTGTAERDKEHKLYTSWFMGYYPASSPRIAFAFVVGRTGEYGGDICGPMARAAAEAWEASLRRDVK